MDFIAVVGLREAVDPGWARYDRLTYAPAVKAGNLLFLSGQGSMNPETRVVERPGDIVAQTRQTYSNLSTVLEAAGAELDSLVKTVEFVTPAGLEHYRSTASVRRELFNAPHPVATGLVCHRLLRPDMLIEVDALAVLS